MKGLWMKPAILAAGLLASSAQAADARLKIVKALPFGGSSVQARLTPSLTATPFYSNIATLQGGFTFGGTVSGTQPFGTTGLVTAMSCDDLSLAPGSPNGAYVLNDVTFSIANADALGLQVAPALIFYDQATGAFIDVLRFDLMHVPGQTIAFVNADLGILGSPITFARDGNGEANIWMCQIYDDANGTALDDDGNHVTPMQYDSLGAGFCNPPSVGSSPDNIYLSDTPIASYATLPPGMQGNLGGDPVANYCNELGQ